MARGREGEKLQWQTIVSLPSAVCLLQRAVTFCKAQRHRASRYRSDACLIVARARKEAPLLASANQLGLIVGSPDAALFGRPTVLKYLGAMEQRLEEPAQGFPPLRSRASCGSSDGPAVPVFAFPKRLEKQILPDTSPGRMTLRRLKEGGYNRSARIACAQAVMRLVK